MAMECLFFEWYEDRGWEVGRGYGRFDVSNNTEALQIITKEGGVSSSLSPIRCVYPGLPFHNSLLTTVQERMRDNRALWLPLCGHHAQSLDDTVSAGHTIPHHQQTEFLHVNLHCQEQSQKLGLLSMLANYFTCMLCYVRAKSWCRSHSFVTCRS